MTHASLFSGIGGFDLAAEWMGWDNIFHCEWNEFGKRILKFYWPTAISYHDITKSDFTIHRGTIDVLTGGFPCQPYSDAGKKQGKDDERHLWPEMLRAIREIQPRWVVGENVRGLVNWSKGLVFHEVQADLEAAGYHVFPFLLPAAGVNAPHERYRIWFIASAGSDGHQSGRFTESGSAQSKGESKGLQRQRFRNDIGGNGKTETAADPRRSRWQEFDPSAITNLSGQCTRNAFNQWDNWPAEPPICNGDDGLSGKLDGIAFSSWRNESIKSGGNAIVPQLALQIFQTIEQYISHAKEI